MVDSYQQALQTLLRDASMDADVECRHFFGGAAAYVDGRICMTLTDAGLALKLPKLSRTKLLGMGGESLRYFPDAPVKRDYVVVPTNIADNRKALAKWIIESIRYARTLPKPNKAT
ncbi:MAG: TfoX/Sxy family protein [Minwuiales bacterium]|nr:TfoX/Sxy family protein [Minwuiales bacterium]